VILFFGRPDDAPLAAAIDEAAARGAAHVILDQALLGTEELVVDVGPDRVTGRLRVGGMELALDEIRAVFARPLALPRFADPLARARAECFHGMFLEWIEDAPCVVVNRPQAMLSNGSKPFQIQLIAQAGFAVPDTLVSNCPEDVRRFHDRHGRVIYKSVSGIRSIVRELDAPALDRLERVRSLPTQFQAYVEGVDVRVHVVGERCFATEIASEATDYRYSHRDGRPAILDATRVPLPVEERCVAVAARLGLPFCGIDLRRRPDGEYACFEVNPMPAFSYFAREAGQPIAVALVDLLMGNPGAIVGSWSRSATT
jgi:glutathione synthase/RimK-type ligase-like ATP-grasp enzyme